MQQLYKRISKIIAFSLAFAVMAAAGALAADKKSDFLNYDMILGDKNAPITIIEYASLTCPHCASFHKEILPELKKKYIDTGKVKLIFRNYVFDNPFDVFAATLNRCVSEKKFFPLAGLYFKRQSTWLKYKEFGELRPYGKYAAMGYAKGEAIKIAKIAGMKESDAYKCLARPEVLKFLMDVNKDAIEKYESIATPMLIVEGEKLDAYDFETIEKAILAASK